MVALVAKLQLFCCFFVIALPTRCKVHFSVSCHVIHQCRNSSETRYVWQKKARHYSQRLHMQHPIGVEWILKASLTRVGLLEK